MNTKTCTTCNGAGVVEWVDTYSESHPDNSGDVIPAEMLYRAPCPTCEGGGVLQDCPDCGGNGVVVISSAYMSDGVYESVCLTCKGSGAIPYSESEASA